MNETSAILFSLALATGGFSVLRMSMRGAWKEVLGRTVDVSPTALRAVAGVLLISSPLPWSIASGAVTGSMSWLFCILCLAPLPLIAFWPFHPRAAVLGPPLAFGCCSLIF